MKYLLTLKNELIAHFTALTPDKVALFIVNGDMPKQSQTVNYVARLVLTDCRLASPFDVLGFVRLWFERYGVDIDLAFECEVIDLETYDLQIDMTLSDKLILTDTGTLVCPPPVWSETLGTWISGAVAGVAP